MPSVPVHGFNASSSAHTASGGLGLRQNQGQSGVMVAALAIAQPNESSIHFPALITLSLLAHAGTVLAIALIMLLLSFFGFSWVNLNPLEMQQRDIEFVIVDAPQAKPRDPNTKNRAAQASRSGGKAVEKKSTALAQRKTGTVSSKAQSQVTPVKASRPQRQPAPQPRQQPTPQPQQQPSPPAPPSPPRPMAPPRPRVNTTSKSRSSSPVLPPSPMAPTIRTPSSGSTNGPTGPIMPSPSSSSNSSNRSNYAAPSQISGGSSRGSSQRNPSQGSPSSAGGSGGPGRENSWGSPGGGGGRPGLDALPEPDYGSYMAELQRRIKRNWQPPRAQEDKRVVALFRIGRDGRLLSVSIKQSSGYVEADGAALNAVRLSAPFRPLPVGHTEADLPVEFTFDYNVYKATRL